MEEETVLLAVVLSFLIFDVVHCSEKSMNQDDIEYAKSVNEDLKNLDLEGFQKMAQHTEFLTGKLEKTQDCENCSSGIQSTAAKEPNIENGILVFVSFSMSGSALKQLSMDSKKYGATLVLRGVYQDSFLKMKDKILSIHPAGLHLSIDPNLFDDYKISRVPTFVLVKNGHEINRLSGNVTLEFASEKLLETQ